jgi:hypothetical protein
MPELPRQGNRTAVMPPGPDPLYVQFPRVLLQEQANAYVFVTGDDWWAVMDPPHEIRRQVASGATWVHCTIAGLGNAAALRADRIVAVIEPNPTRLEVHDG